MPLLHRLIHHLDNYGFQRKPATATPRVPEGTIHPFDLLHHTDTSGHIPGAALATSHTHSDFYNTAYYAISPSTLTQALELLPIPDLAPYTFVDIGCGKGRALLVAAHFPFHALLGVELSPALCQIADKNVALHPHVTIANQDAAALTYPRTPLVLFLYHPFLAPVLRKLLRNLQAQLRVDPRPIWLLYANPTYSHVIAKFRFLRQTWDLSLALSPEDAAADRHGITHERFTLYESVL